MGKIKGKTFTNIALIMSMQWAENYKLKVVLPANIVRKNCDPQA